MNGIVVDTCVVSEPAKPRPDENVCLWFLRQTPSTLFIASTVLAELAVGIFRLPPGARRSRHESWLADVANADFAGRILPFDEAAALTYGRITALSYAQGRPPDLGDAQIAAVALLHDMAVATRDVAGFEPFGVPLVNPWEG